MTWKNGLLCKRLIFGSVSWSVYSIAQLWIDLIAHNSHSFSFPGKNEDRVFSPLQYWQLGKSILFVQNTGWSSTQAGVPLEKRQWEANVERDQKRTRNNRRKWTTDLVLRFCSSLPGNKFVTNLTFFLKYLSLKIAENRKKSRKWTSNERNN